MSVILAMILTLGLAPAVRVSHTTAPAPTGCDGIYAEMIHQGAPADVAGHFAYFIAPRESGCAPKQVHDNDDWSFSRFGLNGLTAGLRTYWRNLCDADVRWDTRFLDADVRCALAAYRDVGWRPWAVDG